MGFLIGLCKIQELRPKVAIMVYQVLQSHSVSVFTNMASLNTTVILAETVSYSWQWVPGHKQLLLLGKWDKLSSPPSVGWPSRPYPELQPTPANAENFAATCLNEIVHVISGTNPRSYWSPSANIMFPETNAAAHYGCEQNKDKPEGRNPSSLLC
jgi:hypothetical protein